MREFKTIAQFWENYRCWFVFFEGGCASCRLCIWDNSPKEAVITDLYIVEVCRQQGFASELLSFCESFAKLQGCDSISLRSDKDDFVRKWYRKQGFEVESSEVWLRKKI